MVPNKTFQKQKKTKREGKKKRLFTKRSFSQKTLIPRAKIVETVPFA